MEKEEVVWKAVQQKSLAEISEALTLTHEVRETIERGCISLTIEPDLKKVEELLQSAIGLGRIESLMTEILPARKETSDNT